MLITRNKHMVAIEEELGMERERDEVAAGGFSSVYAPKWAKEDELIMTTLQPSKSKYLELIYEKHGLPFKKLKTKTKKAHAYSIPRLTPYVFDERDRNLRGAMDFLNVQIGWTNASDLRTNTDPAKIFKKWYKDTGEEMSEDAARVYKAIKEAFDLIKENFGYMTVGMDISHGQFVTTGKGKLICIDPINFK